MERHLPKNRRAYALGAMEETYAQTKVEFARKRVQALVGWLGRCGYDEAAGRLREGMEEILTVLVERLALLLRGLIW